MKKTKACHARAPPPPDGLGRAEAVAWRGEEEFRTLMVEAN